MIYDNIKKKNLIKYKTFDLSPFDSDNLNVDKSILPINNSVKTYNFDTTKGCLSQGLSGSNLEINYDISDSTKIVEYQRVIPGHIIDAFTLDFPNEDCDDGFEHYVGLNLRDTINTFALDLRNEQGRVTNFQIPNMPVKNANKVHKYKIDGVDVVLNFDSAGALVFAPDVYYYQVYGLPMVEQMVIHSNRLFALIRDQDHSISFSEDTNILNWVPNNHNIKQFSFDEQLGKIDKILSLKGYLYVFCEYGVLKSPANIDQDQFEFEFVSNSHGEILKNTIELFDDKIYFVTTQGICVLDGNTIEKVHLDIEQKLDIVHSNNTCAAFHNNKYYICTKIHFKDNQKIGCENYEYTNNAIIEIDFSTNKTNIGRGSDIATLTSLTSYGQKILFATIYNNENEPQVGMVSFTGNNIGVPSQKYWQSGTTDFSYGNKTKVIKSMSLLCQNDCTLIVDYDGKTKEIEIQGSDVQTNVNINIKGKLFGFTFKSDSKKCYIANPKVLVGVYDI